MERVAVIGSPGSGKTTFAAVLGSRLHRPVCHLDDLYWGPEWRPTPEAEWHMLVSEKVSAPSWIIDGHYSSTLHLRLAHADTVIFMDVPTAVCLARVVVRSIRRIFGHNESLPKKLRAYRAPQSANYQLHRFYWFVLTFRYRNISALNSKLAGLEAQGTKVIKLRSRKDAALFIEQLPDHHFPKSA